MAYDLEKAKEALPFLNSEYAYEYLQIRKNKMGENVVSETKIETSYNGDGLITSSITTINGQKSMELIDYKYGEKIRSHTANMYMNDQLYSTQLFSDSFLDEFYRNMLESDIQKKQMGVESEEQHQWTYDDMGRIIGFKQYSNNQLLSEQKDYIWTPTSVEYVTINYSPFESIDKVKKIFKDSDYIQNILETHEIEMNGIKTETRNECDYDDNGNLISLKSYSNGQLLTEWTDYVWANKKSSHKEIMYMNGNPVSETLVEQYYK